MAASCNSAGRCRPPGSKPTAQGTKRVRTWQCTNPHNRQQRKLPTHNTKPQFTTTSLQPCQTSSINPSKLKGGLNRRRDLRHIRRRYERELLCTRRLHPYPRYRQSYHCKTTQLPCQCQQVQTYKAIKCTTPISQLSTAPPIKLPSTTNQQPAILSKATHYP